MSDICEPNDKLIDTSINVIFHVVVLFFIMSMFFIYYVSKIVKQSFENELTQLVKQNIANSLNDLESEEQLALKASLKSVNFDRLIKFYGQEDATIKTHNDWLFRTVIIINILLIILVILLIVGANKLCYKIDVGHLLVENLAIFVGIGIIEFMFFIFVSKSYVPVPPSVMVSSIVDSLKNSLKN